MPSTEKRYYVTTPIYYVNGSPHIGTATTTLLADALKRYQFLRGTHPYFLTGTDENARKVLEAAQKEGKDPLAFVDEVSQRFVETWKFLDCDYDHFFRTTDPRHVSVVQEVFRRLSTSGDIYKGTYEGWYSVKDETFFRDTDVDAQTKVVIAEGVNKGATVERVQEEAYFFKLSAYGDRLKAHILANPDFLLPPTRRNEVLAFIEEGLRDITITQNRTGWGIPVPGAEDTAVVYVWFDALINYLTETGWPDAGYEMLWPCDAHLMAKEIYTRFHATFWPAVLMALDLPLPGHIVGHGWWTVGGEKGAKSKGNIPSPQDMVALLQEASGASERICVDALRYYLVRDIRFSDDSEFSVEMLVSRFNTDLANDLGNVLNRTLRARYHTGQVPTPRALDDGLKAVAQSAVAGYESALEKFDWGLALQSAWTLISAVNVYLAEKTPWIAAKQGDDAAVADAVYNALEGTRLAALLVSPVMPNAAKEMARQLGVSESFGVEGAWETEKRFGVLQPGTLTGEATPLFPRIDTKKIVAPRPPILGEPERKPNIMSDTQNTESAAPANPTTQQTDRTIEMPVEPAYITIDDFAKVQLKVAEVLSVTRVPNADKLLHLRISMGAGDERDLLSAIAEWYTPEELTGKKIVVIANLAPRKMRGIVSQGMLLAVDGPDGRPVLVTPETGVPAGAAVR
ncbi:MAG: methionine--tRNA ligase [Akkermansiaceae bacterium]|nr:methionine--tRNA ligase [Armatimonadota bacterium]